MRNISYSVAETKNRFTEIVRDVEQNSRIQVTRRGKPVAIVLSMRDYQRLSGEQADYWKAYLAFRREFSESLGELDIDAIFADVRVATPGREVQW